MQIFQHSKLQPLIYVKKREKFKYPVNQMKIIFRFNQVNNTSDERPTIIKLYSIFNFTSADNVTSSPLSPSILSNRSSQSYISAYNIKNYSSRTACGTTKTLKQNWPILPRSIFPLPSRFNIQGNLRSGMGGRVLPIMGCMGRLHPKGVPFSGLRYMKRLGRDFTSWSIWQGLEGNQSFWSVKLMT